MNPLIGLTCDESRIPANDPKSQEVYFLKKTYTEAIAKFGGVPLLMPSTLGGKGAQPYLEHIDGLIVTGGDFDIDPSHYGKTDSGGTRQRKHLRTDFEKAMLEAAEKRGMPVLGICGGMQLMNVCRGGTLLQHVDGHEGKTHAIFWEKDSYLGKLLSTKSKRVGSSHHQAVDALGKGLRIAARAEDGVVEVIENLSQEVFFLGLQWHPEAMLGDDPSQGVIFERFLAAARTFREKA